MTDIDDPHGGTSCAETEAWADDMRGDINSVTLYLARHGYLSTPPDDDLFGQVFNALEIAASTGQTRRLAWPVPEEWFA